MAAIGTQRPGCDDAVLAPGRQLPAYVLAADFANQRGTASDATFRSWLSAGVVAFSGASGGTGWNGTKAARQMPWLPDLRCGTSIPTQTAGIGRAIGFTDWLYGGGASGGGGSSSPPPPPGDPRVVDAQSVRLTTTSLIRSSGLPVYVAWRLKSSLNGVSRTSGHPPSPSTTCTS